MEACGQALRASGFEFEFPTFFCFVLCVGQGRVAMRGELTEARFWAPGVSLSGFGYWRFVSGKVPRWRGG